MAERSIIFSGPMVRAILEGRKTQTRRVMKPQPTTFDNTIRGPVGAAIDLINIVFQPRELAAYKLPYGQPGDLLYVRETWAASPNKKKTWYRADGKEDPWVKFALPEFQFCGWRPSTHMPKAFTRIWLCVKDVRVERVQGTSAHDITHHWGVTPDDNYRTNAELVEIASKSWDSIYAKRGFGWEANPWVWVLEFERCKNVTP